MDRPKLTAPDERGYFSGSDIRNCEFAGMKAYVPKPLTSVSGKKRLFTKRDFIYFARNDEYRCLAGERAMLRFKILEHDMNLHVYWSSARPRCHLKGQYLPNTTVTSDDGSTKMYWKPCSVGSTRSLMQ
ncbi:hypothetical protein SAMN06265784_11963 [Paraburkholderia susongensis]|uniref:Uncharacterized protein n=1 Tax=Paraburkholderia susongensis TaxID=1515439 RepID=A0A1X7M4X0_9BURK|nr:hypothetical protein SAMN06265784_11963 [Paraburkholderia susongensis]